MMDTSIYTAKEVALRLKISPSQVYALVQSGRLRCLRITARKQGGLRFTAEHLEEFLEASEQPPPAPRVFTHG